MKEVRFMSRHGNALGFKAMPLLGPFVLGQHNGMMQAILMEMRAPLEPGRKNLQSNLKLLGEFGQPPQ